MNLNPNSKIELCPYMPPCKDCKERYVGCHSKCEKYLEYEAKCKILRDERKKQSELIGGLKDSRKEIIKRSIHNKRKA